MKRVMVSILLSTVSFLSAKIIVASSIEPISSLIKSIAKDRVEVVTIVKTGVSPHTYEPKISQMRRLERVKLYFAVGVEFEKSWLNRFKSQNQNIKVIHLENGIKDILIKSNNRVRRDPHIWLSPKNMVVISKKIFNTLASVDEESRELYKKGLETLLERIKQTDETIKSTLLNTPKGTKFMVFHPSWSYFAREYGLIQLPIELEGKEPKPSWIIKLIKTAKREKIRAIITQPEFSSKSAEILAKELNVGIVPLSPLSPNWQKSLIILAEAISKRASK